MAKERKEFTVGEKKLFTRFATVEENRQADIEYSKVYNQCLKDGLPLAAELEKMLRDRGVFNAEKDASYEKIHKDFQETVNALYVERDPEKREKLGAHLKQAKLDLLELNNERSRHMVNTVEYRCDEARMAYIVPCVTENEDGSRYWKNQEEFKNESDTYLVQMAVYHFVSLVNNISDNFFDETPEAVGESEAQPVEAQEKTGAV